MIYVAGRLMFQWTVLYFNQSMLIGLHLFFIFTPGHIHVGLDRALKIYLLNLENVQDLDKLLMLF